MREGVNVDGEYILQDHVTQVNKGIEMGPEEETRLTRKRKWMN